MEDTHCRNSDHAVPIGGGDSEFDVTQPRSLRGPRPRQQPAVHVSAEHQAPGPHTYRETGGPVRRQVRRQVCSYVRRQVW